MLTNNANANINSLFSGTKPAQTRENESIRIFGKHACKGTFANIIKDRVSATSRELCCFYWRILNFARSGANRQIYLKILWGGCCMEYFEGGCVQTIRFCASVLCSAFYATFLMRNFYRDFSKGRKWKGSWNIFFSLCFLWWSFIKKKHIKISIFSSKNFSYNPHWDKINILSHNINRKRQILISTIKINKNRKTVKFN